MNSENQEEIKEVLDRIKKSNGVVTAQNYFVQVPNSFIRNPNLKSKEKLLYIYLWGFGGASMNMYPSQARMKKELGWSIPTIIDTLKSLEEKGGLYIINRVYKSTKEKSTNLYYLAEIDNSTGCFNKKSIKIVKSVYPDKIVFI